MKVSWVVAVGCGLAAWTTVDSRGRVMVAAIDHRVEQEKPADGSTSGLSTRYLKVRLSPVDKTAAPGERVTLSLDLTPGPKMHVYAPGQAGYITIAIELDASAMMIAIEHEVRVFAMPGTGIPDFEKHAQRIARAGIYDFSVHYEQILVPVVLRHWNVEGLTGLTPDAEVARDALLERIERIGTLGRRMAAKRAELDSVPA